MGNDSARQQGDGYEQAAEIPDYRGGAPYVPPIPGSNLDAHHRELGMTGFSAPVSGINLTDLLSAFARFASEQTMFLETGAGTSGDEYLKNVSHYSREQTKLIRAQNEALRQLGIIQ